MTRNDADMITSKPQIVSSALRPTVHPHTRLITVAEPVPVTQTTASYRLAKRVFDFSVASLLLVILSPLILLIYIAIKLDDHGPALIVQKRVGLGGEIFDFYKFRSMTVGVDHTQAHKDFAQQVIRGEITRGPQSNGEKPAWMSYRSFSISCWAT